MQLKRGSLSGGRAEIQQARLRSCSCLLKTELAVESAHHSNGSPLAYKPFLPMKIAAQSVL